MNEVTEMEKISKDIREKILERKQLLMQEAERLQQETLSEALVLAQSGNYVDAIKKYELAYSRQPEESIQNSIKDCTEKLEKLNKYKISFDVLLSRNISSIPAFTGVLKKWMKINAYVLNDEDKQKTKDRFIAIYQQLKKGDRKKWDNKKLWNEISDLLGEDLYEIVLKSK